MAVTIDDTTGVSAVQDGAVESGDLPAGSVIQVATDTFDGVATSSAAGTPNIISNGAQLFSVTFTPISATNTILVQTSSVVISEESNLADICWLSLFDGTTFIAANSGSSKFDRFSGLLNMAHQSINHSYTAGSTNARVIQVRAGMNETGTAYINGNSVYNYATAQARIQMTVWEIAA